MSTTQAANDQAQNQYKAKIQANCFIFFLNIFADSYQQAQEVATKQVQNLKRKQRINKVQLLGLERVL